MENQYKIVNLYKHCPSCRYEEVEEENVPCSECLCYPVNEHTDRPVKWEEKKE